MSSPGIGIGCVGSGTPSALLPGRWGMQGAVSTVLGEPPEPRTDNPHLGGPQVVQNLTLRAAPCLVFTPQMCFSKITAKGLSSTFLSLWAVMVFPSRSLETTRQAWGQLTCSRRTQ